MNGIFQALNNLQNRLDNKFERLEKKTDERMHSLENKISKVDKHLDVYNTQLEKHIEGVELAREELKILKDYVDIEKEKLETSINSRLEPVEKHYRKEKTKNEITKERMDKSLKWLGGISIILAIIKAIVYIFTV